MTQRWAYVGDLGEGGALDWGGSYSGNIPTGGRLPDLNSKAFWRVYRLAEDGAYAGRQLDWGAWGIKVNGPQLREVLISIYGEALTVAPIPQYLALADELGETQFIAFVAAEL